MRYEKIILISLLVSLLSACSSFFHNDHSAAAETSATTTEDKQQTVTKKPPTAPVSSDVSSDQETSNPVATVATTTTHNPVSATAIQPSTTQTITTTTSASTPAANAPITSAPASIASTTTNPIVTANQPPANGLVALSMNMEYQKAWSQLGNDLPKAGYPVVEQDGNAGIYYILDKVGSGGKITPQTPIYQLHVQKITADKTRVFLYDAQNQPADSALARRILGSVTTH